MTFERCQASQGQSQVKKPKMTLVSISLPPLHVVKEEVNKRDKNPFTC